MDKNSIEQKIRSLSADYIYQQAVGSLLLLLVSAMEEEEQGVTAIPYEIPEDVLAIRREIRKHLLQLPETLEEAGEKREKALADCLSLKQRLLDIYRPIYPYFTQWELLFDVISDQLALFHYKDEHVADKAINWGLFYADCRAFLDSASNPAEKMDYMGQMLKCIPLLMARDLFYDEIERALIKAFSGESTASIAASLSVFESFCCPSAVPDYGKYFPEIATDIAKRRMLLPHKQTRETLLSLYEEMETLLHNMRDIEEYFSCILNDINSLIILFYLTYTFEDLTQGNVAYKDLYHAVCEFIDGEWTLTEKAAYLDRLNTQLDEAVEPVIDRARETAQKEIALLEKAGSFEGFAEETKKTLIAEEIIRDCYYSRLEDALRSVSIPQDLPPATPAEIKQLCHVFLDKTRSDLDTLPAKTRKAAMQLLLAAVPPSFTTDQIINRIMDAMAAVPAVEQQLLIVDKIGDILAQNGYVSLAEPPEDLLDEDDACTADCSCGHDHMHGHHHEHHHHGHDCDCGHTHHHE